jgi:hypothetical protein
MQSHQRRLRLVAMLAAAPLAAWPAPAGALTIGGGGTKSTDCLVVFQVGDGVPLKGTKISCVDGDPSCDADGAINGSCQIPVAVCANSTALSTCTLSGVRSITVQHALDNGDRKFDPEFQALQTRIDDGIDLPSSDPDQCALPTNFHVPIKGPFKSGAKNKCGSITKTLSLSSVSQVIAGRTSKDTDRLKLRCAPAPIDGCDPQVLFTGTFDRIQRQILNQSCALSGCHDSQSQTGDLLLESGASYTNLIDAVPQNGSALAQGWKRVHPGDPTTSFLYHKVTGDLPDPSFGARMPFGKPKLNKTLIGILQAWITGGAPDTGWVAGTD